MHPTNRDVQGRDTRSPKTCCCRRIPLIPLMPLMPLIPLRSIAKAICIDKRVTILPTPEQRLSRSALVATNPEHKIRSSARPPEGGTCFGARFRGQLLVGRSMRACGRDPAFQSRFHGRAGALRESGGVGGCDGGRIALGFEKAAEEAAPKSVNVSRSGRC